jgi:hypothetical protein
MKIKEIYVEAKKSSRFQTYTCGFTAEIDEKDNVIEARKQLQLKAREAVLEEIGKDEDILRNPYIKK